jgi:hypothetical protein
MTENALLQGRDVDGGPLLSSYRPLPVGARPSSISSPFKGVQQVELELRLLEALAIYHPSKLAGTPLAIYHPSKLAGTPFALIITSNHSRMWNSC